MQLVVEKLEQRTRYLFIKALDEHGPHKPISELVNKEYLVGSVVEIYKTDYVYRLDVKSSPIKSVCISRAELKENFRRLK